MELRKAKSTDIDTIMEIMAQARGAQRKAGFRQWGDDYPSVDMIQSDISNQQGYVLDDNGHVAGYVVIAFDDPEYNRHNELWETEEKYGVMHRIAIGDNYRGKGISHILFDLSEALIASRGATSIRIDTGVENLPMQHILSCRDYMCLGECDFIWGKRYAYEKIVQNAC